MSLDYYRDGSMKVLRQDPNSTPPSHLCVLCVCVVGGGGEAANGIVFL